jgi:DNA modification methylase
MGRRALGVNTSGEKYIRMALVDVIPDIANMRIHSDANIQAIMASLARWGQQKPIVIDAGNVVRCGNGTLEAAKRLKWTEIECIRSDLTGAELAAFAIADNRTAELAGWSEEIGPFLKSLAGELPDLPLVDLGFVGLEALALPPVADEQPGADDEAPTDKGDELQAKWKCERSQLWACGRHLLLCGDATSEADVKRLLGDKVPNLMVTDPPYGVEYEPEWRDEVLGGEEGGRATRKVAGDERCDWTDAFALFPGNVAYVWHADKHCGSVLKSLQDAGFTLRNQIIWAKTQFVVSRGHYNYMHEPCFYLVRNGKTANWRAGHDQTTLWTIEKPHKSESGHSTQKPLACMFTPMRNHESEYTYDPFCGSGTSILAAEQLGRTCLAMDIDPVACSICLERWLAVTGVQPTLVCSNP